MEGEVVTSEVFDVEIAEASGWFEEQLSEYVCLDWM